MVKLLLSSIMECITSVLAADSSYSSWHSSYLFFADDLLLLAEANIDQAEVINIVLDTFLPKLRG